MNMFSPLQVFKDGLYAPASPENRVLVPVDFRFVLRVILPGVLYASLDVVSVFRVTALWSSDPLASRLSGDFFETICCLLTGLKFFDISPRVVVVSVDVSVFIGPASRFRARSFAVPSSVVTFRRLPRR